MLPGGLRSPLGSVSLSLQLERRSDATIGGQGSWGQETGDGRGQTEAELADHYILLFVVLGGKHADSQPCSTQSYRYPLIPVVPAKETYKIHMLFLLVASWLSNGSDMKDVALLHLCPWSIHMPSIPLADM